MPNVALTARAIAVDGRELYLCSGEIHYFRLPRSVWDERIHAARDGGLNCISSYIPWFWHESDEGEVDFTGATVPERDILGFIDAVHRAGLYFIARPGPFINAELALGGHPRWLFERYPEIISRRSDGSSAFWVTEGVPVPSQLHPTYLRLVEGWYRRIVPLLAARTVPKGGPIILLQPDNEPNLIFTYGVDGSLYDDHVAGESGLWARWRAASGHQGAIRVPTPDEEDQGLLLDWLRFKQWHVFEFLRRLMDLMRELGVDVPFVVNEPLNRYWSWKGGEHAAFGAANHDRPVFTAGHCYFTYGGEQDALGLPVSIARIEAVKMSRLPGPPCILELGSWFSLEQGGRASPNWDAMLRTLVGCGMNAFNVYVYASGQSPPGSARIGRDYDWITAIRLDGRPDAPYETIRRLAAFVQGWEREILTTEKRVDAVVGLASELPLLPQIARGPNRALGSLAQAVHDSIVELLRTLTLLNVNVEFTSLTHPSERFTAPVLIIPCAEVFPRETAANVRGFVERGGTLVLYPVLPRYDSRLQPFELFPLSVIVKTVLGPGGLRPGDFRWRMVDGAEAKEVGIQGFLVTYAADDGVDVLATFQNEACAVSVGMGKGRIILCGLLPQYFTVESQRLFEEILVQSSGVARVCRASEPAVVTVRGSPTHQLITVVDVFGHRRGLRLTVATGDGPRTFPMTAPLVLAPSEARLLWVDLDCGYARIRHCTSELVPQDATRRRLLAFGAPGTPGEIAFDRRVRVRTNGTLADLQLVSNMWVCEYRHGLDPLVLEIES